MCQRIIGALRLLFGCAAFAISILILALALPSLSKDDPWFIDPSGKTGKITSTTSNLDLLNVYGKKNVVDGEMNFAEGEVIPSTILFPRSSLRRITISWKDPDQKRNPDRVQIHGDKSLWKTSLGLTLGLTLEEVERINGRPLILTNYETDYDGTVRSWEGGVFDSAMESQGHVAVRLLRPAKLFVTVEELDKMTDEGLEISSSNPILRKMNPRVSEITWYFK
jgi:hypothetical protein